MEMYVCQNTNIGLMRDENQDDLAWFTLSSGELFILADGMGGEAGGRFAAKMAIATIKSCYESQQNRDIVTLMEYSIKKANQKIYEIGSSDDLRYHNMGTTIAILFISKEKAYIAHVGDSRIYLYRDNNLKLLTKDQTLVQSMIDKGKLTPDEARVHPKSHVLLQSVGANSDIVPDIKKNFIKINSGDLFFMCSDGLHGVLDDSLIIDIINKNEKLNDICNELVTEALNHKSQDNVTVQVICFI